MVSAFLGLHVTCNLLRSVKEPKECMRIVSSSVLTDPQNDRLTGRTSFLRHTSVRVRAVHQGSCAQTGASHPLRCHLMPAARSPQSRAGPHEITFQPAGRKTARGEWQSSLPAKAQKLHNPRQHKLFAETAPRPHVLRRAPGGAVFNWAVTGPGTLSGTAGDREGGQAVIHN